MEKLNVYENHLKGSYCGGILIVAAHNEKEAHEICIGCPRLKGLYWNYYIEGSFDYEGFCQSDGNIADYDNSTYNANYHKPIIKDGVKYDLCSEYYSMYDPKGFKLIPNLTYEGEPCVIAEDSYCE